jgi:hypothetical protein
LSYVSDNLFYFELTNIYILVYKKINFKNQLRSLIDREYTSISFSCYYEIKITNWKTWRSGKCAWRAIAEAKHLHDRSLNVRMGDQKSSTPCFGRQLKPLIAPMALGPVGYGPFLLFQSIRKVYGPAVGTKSFLKYVQI